jgi:polar amino acid transport system substrate-binding protein
LPIFAYFIATLSSNITILTLRSTIGGPQDLVERRVGVLDGSTSQEYMREIKAVVYSFDRIDDAYKWLIGGRLDAVVYDRPNLQFYTQHEGKGKVEVVGRTFAPQDYGMAIPQGSPLREDLNRVLLAMREDGTLERIRSKWFGFDP